MFGRLSKGSKLFWFIFTWFCSIKIAIVGASRFSHPSHIPYIAENIPLSQSELYQIGSPGLWSLHSSPKVWSLKFPHAMLSPWKQSRGRFHIPLIYTYYIILYSFTDWVLGGSPLFIDQWAPNTSEWWSKIPWKIRENPWRPSSTSPFPTEKGLEEKDLEVIFGNNALRICTCLHGHVTGQPRLTWSILDQDDGNDSYNDYHYCD